VLELVSVLVLVLPVAAIIAHTADTALIVPPTATAAVVLMEVLLVIVAILPPATTAASLSPAAVRACCSLTIGVKTTGVKSLG
jgi:hypothetical protein